MKDNELNISAALTAQTMFIQSLACALHEAGALPDQPLHRYLNHTEQVLARGNREALEYFQRFRDDLLGLLQSVDAMRSKADSSSA